MTDLADIALEFCRECLGWPAAKLSMWGQHSNGMVVSKRSRSVTNRLRYTDLNAVMEAVRGWCDEHDLILETSHYKGSHMSRVFSNKRCDEAWQHDDNLCKSLLFSCLEANRKLKASA